MWCGVREHVGRGIVSFKGREISILFGGLFFPALLKVLDVSTMAAVSKVFIKRNINDSKVTTMGVYIPLLVSLVNIKLVVKTNYSMVTSVCLSGKGAILTHTAVARTVLFIALVSMAIKKFVLTFPRRATHVLNSSRRLLPLIISCLI